MFVLKSAAFDEGERIPAEFANRGAHGGENLSLPLEWAYAPNGTESFALAMIDHHPVASEFVHWLVANIPGGLRGLKRGASGTDQMPPEALELMTSYGSPGYGGPRPPAGTGDHPYETTLYALSADKLDLDERASFDAFLRALEGKVLAKPSLTGYFSQ
ncbi:MAG: YbhB/YbcL family Raf kinase inhibitor-like protein [Terriglobia bacterium]